MLAIALATPEADSNSTKGRTHLPRTCTTEPGVNLPGNDLRKQCVGGGAPYAPCEAGSAAECRDRCAARNRCNGYVHAAPDASAAGSCYLKGGELRALQPLRSAGFVSGWCVPAARSPWDGAATTVLQMWFNEPQSATQALTPPEYVTHMLCRNEQYARSHGYSYQLEARRQLPNTFAPSWERLPAMLRLLARERVPRQIIMYLDTDVQVIDHSRKAHELFEACGDAELMMTIDNDLGSPRDTGYCCQGKCLCLINNGLMVLRPTSSWLPSLMHEMLNDSACVPYHGTRQWEQDCMQLHLQRGGHMPPLLQLRHLAQRPISLPLVGPTGKLCLHSMVDTMPPLLHSHLYPALDNALKPSSTWSPIEDHTPFATHAAQFCDPADSACDKQRIASRLESAAVNTMRGECAAPSAMSSLQHTIPTEPSQPAATSPVCTEVRGIDLPGHDLLEQCMGGAPYAPCAAASAAQCRERCTAHSHCHAYVHAAADAASKGACYLKDRGLLGHHGHSAPVVSGKCRRPIDEGGDTTMRTCTQAGGVDLPGNDLRQQCPGGTPYAPCAAGSAIECRERCAAKGRCHAYVFLPGMCYLKARAALHDPWLPGPAQMISGICMRRAQPESKGAAAAEPAHGPRGMIGISGLHWTSRGMRTRAKPSQCEAHVAVGAGLSESRSLLALLVSMIQNHPPTSPALCIYVYSYATDKQGHAHLLACLRLRLGELPHNIHMQQNGFSESDFVPEIRSLGPETRSELLSPYNWFRFYIRRRDVHNAQWVLYIDSDAVVRGDLTPLFRLPLRCNDPDGCIAAAVSYSTAHNSQPLKYYLCDRVSTFAPEIMGETAINAGILLMNLEAWTSANVLERWSALVEEHKRSCLWKLASQPELQLLQPNGIFRLNSTWVSGDLGWAGDGARFGKEYASNLAAGATQAVILHWNGQRKPWASAHALLADLWHPYDRASSCEYDDSATPEDARFVHVVLLARAFSGYTAKVETLIANLRAWSRSPQRLQFHVLTDVTSFGRPTYSCAPNCTGIHLSLMSNTVVMERSPLAARWAKHPYLSTDKRASYFIKLFLHHLLPQLDKVMVLDDDVFAMADICDMWDDVSRSFHTHPDAAIAYADEQQPEYHAALGFAGLNGGVGVLHLRRLRESRTYDDYLRALTGRIGTGCGWKTPPEDDCLWNLVDQTALTFVRYDLPSLFVPLQCEWNWQVALYYWVVGQHGRFGTTTQMPGAECHERPKLLHFNFPNELKNTRREFLAGATLAELRANRELLAVAFGQGEPARLCAAARPVDAKARFCNASWLLHHPSEHV